MAPIVVTLMVVVHACAPPRARAFSLTALGWMLFVAALTMTVHFIELTVVAVSMRRLLQPERPRGMSSRTGWTPPSPKERGRADHS
jgi:hypothetical protein